MERRGPLVLVDTQGVPFPDDLQDVFTALVPRLLRQFPQVQDPVLLVEVLEEAAQRVRRRQTEGGALANAYGFAWVTVKNVTLSRLQRGSSQVAQRTIAADEAAQHLLNLPAREASPEAIERRILVREAFEHLSQEERLIIAWKQAGCSSAWIAARLGRSVSAVDTAYSRAKHRLRRLLGGDRAGQVRDADVEWSGAAQADPAPTRLADLFAPQPAEGRSVQELRPWLVDEDV